MSEIQESITCRMRRQVEAICLPEGRVVGSDGHWKTRKYLEKQLQKYGFETYHGESFELPYERHGQAFCNLIAKVPGRDPALPPLLVGAHYDSAIAAPCADDNAAAVAIAFELGKMTLEAGGLDRDLIVAIFDAEEMPYFSTGSMGSQRFYAEQRQGREIHAALIMDLVGHDVSVHSSLFPAGNKLGTLWKKIPFLRDRDLDLPLLHSLLFVTGTESHPELAAILQQNLLRHGLRVVPTLNRYVGDMSDHGIFRENGVPYFFLSCGRWAHYHQITDTPERLNYQKMDKIRQQSYRLLCALDKRLLARNSSGQETYHDTLELERSQMQGSFGLFWPFLLKRAKLKNVATRSDMNRLVESILGLGV